MASWSRALQLAVQPCARHRPLTLDGPGRNIQRFSGLLDVTPTEVTYLDDYSLSPCLRSRRISVTSPVRLLKTSPTITSAMWPEYTRSARKMALFAGERRLNI